MIIDCHGHYTTTPQGVADWRDAQTAAVAADPTFVGEKGSMIVSDDEIRTITTDNPRRLLTIG